MPLKKHNAQKGFVFIPSTDRYAIFGDNRLKYQVQNLCIAYILHTVRFMQGEISISIAKTKLVCDKTGIAGLLSLTT